MLQLRVGLFARQLQATCQHGARLPRGALPVEQHAERVAQAGRGLQLEPALKQRRGCTRVPKRRLHATPRVVHGRERRLQLHGLSVV